MAQRLEDDSWMPFGKYGPDKGDHRQMANIPPSYLLYLKDLFAGKKNGPIQQEVLLYVYRNQEALEKELEDNSKNFM